MIKVNVNQNKKIYYLKNGQYVTNLQFVSGSLMPFSGRSRMPVS